MCEKSHVAKTESFFGEPDNLQIICLFKFLFILKWDVLLHSQHQIWWIWKPVAQPTLFNSTTFSAYECRQYVSLLGLCSDVADLALSVYIWCQTLLSPQHQGHTAVVLWCIIENVFCYISLNLILASFKTCVFIIMHGTFYRLFKIWKKKTTFILWLELDVIVDKKKGGCVSLV